MFAAGAATCAALAAAGIVLVLGGGERTCEQWAASDGLTGQAVVIVCQTGANASGDMAEAEYRERMNDSLTEVKSIIDETGGL